MQIIAFEQQGHKIQQHSFTGCQNLLPLLCFTNNGFNGIQINSGEV